MANNTFNDFSKQFEQMTQPVQQFAELTVNHAEKLMQFQLDAARSYADYGVEQTRAALAVNDANSLQSYVKQQQEAASNLSKKVTDDVGTLAEFGKTFSEEAGKIANEGVNVAEKTASKARKSA